MNRKNVKVHKLVSEYFLGEQPANTTIDHIDRDTFNNRVDNLRYATIEEQTLNRVLPERNNKKAILQYDIDRNFIAEYDSMAAADKATGINYKNISKAINRSKTGFSGGFYWKVKE